jgi:hypothetical protein
MGENREVGKQGDLLFGSRLTEETGIMDAVLADREE